MAGGGGHTIATRQKITHFAESRESNMHSFIVVHKHLNTVQLGHRLCDVQGCQNNENCLGARDPTKSSTLVDLGPGNANIARHFIQHVHNTRFLS